MITLFLATALALQDESAHYAVDYLVPPEGAVLEVGGMDFLPDGRLALSTRRGQVWLVTNPLAENPADAEFQLYCEGLWEGLGLRVIDGAIHVVQRGELSRLDDVDGDGVCDDVVTVSDDWGLSGNYHEFAYGLPVDADGNAYVTLNVGFFSPKWWHGKSTAPYRGWALRVAPDGAVTPFASGFRSPCGVSLSPAGELFVTDNQGDWMPASPVFRVKQGGFYGHPASLDWTEEYLATQTLASDTIPPARASRPIDGREPPAIWLPYKWSRSPGDLAWDESGGAFGPFGGQTFVSELTNGMVLRAGFEEVNGVLQGWVTPFRRGIGSVVRVLFAPDGTLFCGFTNRGWGGLAPADGIGRIRYTGAEPFEVHAVELLGREGDAPGGFRATFTGELDADWLAAAEADPAAAFAVTQYDYDYWWEYGSPERDTSVLTVQDVDGVGRSLTLRAAGLVPGRMARVRLLGCRSADGRPLLHDEFAYTLNVLPGATPEESAVPVARVAPPPPARESGQEGWLRLTYGDATDAWHQAGWELIAAELDPEDPTRFRVKPGNSHLTNTGSETPSHFVSKATFGDAKIHVDFTLPADGRVGFYVMGRYGLLFADGEFEAATTTDACGAVVGGKGFAGRAPEAFAYRGAGQLHEVDIEFQAPRFDADGKKIANARFVRVRIDDVLLHENVELPGPSDGAPLEKERATGPLVFRGDQGPVAIGNIKVQPQRSAEEGEPEAEAGWTPLIDLEAVEPLAGWTITEEGYWYVDDEILIGEGPRSHLFSPRGDYGDFELRVEAKVSDGGNSGVLFRAPFAEIGWPAGYEAELNCSFADPKKTGSLIGLTEIKTHLVAPDTWFELRLTCRTESDGAVRITQHLNGVQVGDARDDSGTAAAAGHIALQQHHDGSVVEFRRLELRELP